MDPRELVGGLEERQLDIAVVRVERMRVLAVRVQDGPSPEQAVHVMTSASGPPRFPVVVETVLRKGPHCSLDLPLLDQGERSLAGAPVPQQLQVEPEPTSPSRENVIESFEHLAVPTGKDLPDALRALMELVLGQRDDTSPFSASRLARAASAAASSASRSRRSSSITRSMSALCVNRGSPVSSGWSVLITTARGMR